MAQASMMQSVARRSRSSRALWPALAAIAGFLSLPFSRPGRVLTVVHPDHYPWAIGSPILWLVLAAAAAALVLSLLPIHSRRRGDLLSGVSALGFFVGVGWLIVMGAPFGLGSVVSLTALLIVLGAGLSEAGRIQGDSFIASSILVVSLAVALLIIYPLFSIMRGAFIIDGQLTLSALQRTISSNLFLFIENPFTEVSELARVRWTAGVSAALAVLWCLLRPTSFRGVLGRLIFAALAGYILGTILWARGALPSSLGLVLIVAPGATTLGLVFALLSQRTRLPALKTPLDAVGLLPIITPPFVLAFSMVFLFGRRGLVTYHLFGLSTDMLYGLGGVAVTQILGIAPICYLILRGTLQSMNPSLEEAARTAGASRQHILRTVTWPLLRPGLAAAMLLATIESVADFGTPLLLGGDRTFLATEVYHALIGRYNPSEAASYGVVLLAIVFLVFFINRLWLGTKAFTTVTGKPTGGRYSPLPLGLEIGLMTGFVLWAMLVVALYTTVFVGSFTNLWGFDHSFTLRHYQEFFAGTGWPVLLNTARLAATSALPAMLIGLLIGYLVSRHRFPGRRFVEFGSLLSFATPGTVMGVAYILAFNEGPWLLTGTSTIIILALVFRNMPITIRASMAALSQIDRSMEEASETLKASSSYTLRRILVPLVVHALVAGFIFAFVTAMTAVSQVIFLVSPGNQLATVLLLGWVEQGKLGVAAVMGTILILSMIVVIAIALAVGRRAGMRGAEVGMG